MRPDHLSHKDSKQVSMKSNVINLACVCAGNPAYRKVKSYNMCRLEAHAGFFRLLMKGILDPYLL